MNGSNPLTIPETLISDLIDGDVCLFVGAGISLGTHGQMGLPSALKLAEDLARQYDPTSTSRTPPSLRDAAQEYKGKYGDVALRRYIVQEFDRRSLAPLRTHRALARLPIHTVVTTNYDQLIELALAEEGKSFKRIIDASHIPYVTGGDIAVIKLHGCVTDPDSMVITDDDYWNFRNDVDARIDILKSVLLSKTLLFLGYGLADENFVRLFQDVYHKAGGHIRRGYAVQKDPDEREVERWKRRELQILNGDATLFLEELDTLVKKNTLK